MNATEATAGTDGAAVPTPEELVSRAEHIARQLPKYAAQQEAERKVAPGIIEMIADAGLFRVLQPRRWGGYEMHPQVFTDVQIALARGDMSVGWVYGVIGCHNFQMGLFDDRAAQDVWGERTDTRIASTFQPGGVATPVDGGYRFSGRWKFASGCDHADWVYLGGSLDGEFLTCLLPRDQYEIVDAWNVHGLKATGSQDILVDNVVIPEHRVHKSSDGFKCDSPGNKVNTGWLYRIPFHQIFIRAITAAAIGALEAMIAAYSEYAQSRISIVAGPAAIDPDAQLALGEAIVLVDELKCVIARNYEVLEGHARAGELPPFETRLLFKYQASAVAAQCLAAGRRIFENAGGTGLFNDQPFGRILSDLTAANQHAAAQHHLAARSLGKLKLGQDVQEWYL